MLLLGVSISFLGFIKSQIILISSIEQQRTADHKKQVERDDPLTAGCCSVFCVICAIVQCVRQNGCKIVLRVRCDFYTVM